jgi:glycerophosphoryl diester phosphodiesterase
MRRWSPALRRLDWLVARPIAHRGLHDVKHGVVENTASAFAAAIDGGYAIECDLQRSGDGEAMVFHDDTVDRLMGGKVAVGAMPARELRKLAFNSGQDRIQTLGELLDQVDGRAPLVIELKSHWNGNQDLLARALAVLETYAGPYALMSFDPEIIASLRERSPETVRGIVADRATDPFYDCLPVSRRVELQRLTHVHTTQPHFVSFDWRDFPFAPVDAFRRHGGPVISWTIRDVEAASRARRYSDQITFEGFLA